MNLFSSNRPVVRTSVCVAALLAASISFGGAADRPQVQAQLLDHAEFLCANCFFGASDYYYCFEADNRILIGYQKTPVLNWEDQSKNYMTGVRPRWSAWSASGQTVPISYDDKYIWVTRPEAKPANSSVWAHMKAFGIWASRGDTKQVRLKRSSMADIFTNNDRCRAAASTKAR